MKIVSFVVISLMAIYSFCFENIIVENIGDILINIVSDFIYWVAISLIFWFLYVVFNRNRMRRFFGVSKNKRLVIYTSNLYVEEYTSKGVDGIKYSFCGDALPKIESEAAYSMKGLFNFILPSRIERYGILSKIFLSDIDVQVIPAERDGNVFENEATVITLGFPAYNSFSKQVVENFQLPAKLYRKQSLDNGDCSLNSHEKQGQGTSASTVSRAEGAAISESTDEKRAIEYPIIVMNEKPYEDNFIGFIQIIKDEKNNRFVFYVAGLSEHTTAGCLYYLKKNWGKLSKKIKSFPFSVILRISNSDIGKGEIVDEST